MIALVPADVLDDLRTRIRHRRSRFTSSLSRCICCPRRGSPEGTAPPTGTTRSSSPRPSRISCIRIMGARPGPGSRSSTNSDTTSSTRPERCCSTTWTGSVALQGKPSKSRSLRAIALPGSAGGGTAAGRSHRRRCGDAQACPAAARNGQRELGGSRSAGCRLLADEDGRRGGQTAGGGVIRGCELAVVLAPRQPGRAEGAARSGAAVQLDGAPRGVPVRAGRRRSAVLRHSTRRRRPSSRCAVTAAQQREPLGPGAGGTDLEGAGGFCAWCGDERDVGWCDNCSGRRCRSCQRCGCQTPIKNPLCPQCHLHSPFRPTAHVCMDCEAAGPGIQ